MNSQKNRTPAAGSVRGSHGKGNLSSAQAVQEPPGRLTSTLPHGPRSRPNRVSGTVDENKLKIIWPTQPIPIERTLNGRNLILSLAKTSVVLTPTQARRLAYSLLLEAEMTRTGRKAPSD
jgi:hypothetical protein